MNPSDYNGYHAEQRAYAAHTAAQEQAIADIMEYYNYGESRELCTERRADYILNVLGYTVEDLRQRHV